MPSTANHWSPQRPEWRPANARPFPRQIVLALANLLPKSHPRAFILFTSGFWNATCNYFNCFGPWTADVQGPLLNLSPMSMVMPASHGNPPPARADNPSCPAIPAIPAIIPPASRAPTIVRRALPIFNEIAAFFRISTPPRPHFPPMKICKTLCRNHLTN